MHRSLLSFCYDLAVDALRRFQKGALRGMHPGASSEKQHRQDPTVSLFRLAMRMHMLWTATSAVIPPLPHSLTRAYDRSTTPANCLPTTMARCILLLGGCGFSQAILSMACAEVLSAELCKNELAEADSSSSDCIAR